MRYWLSQPRDPAGLAAFRLLFGTLMILATLRFWAKGWIEAIYLKPRFHFTYVGFEWVRPWASFGMYLHFALMVITALCIALGIKTRWTAAIFFALFLWAELIEKAVYLNHYYLVTLLAFLLMFVPTDRAWALWPHQDAKTRRSVGAWAYFLLRAQMALVYLFAGLAKLNSDWLLRAEPLQIWLQNYQSWPMVGPWLASTAAAYAMSWAGAVFDITIWIWLSLKRFRPFAYAVAIFFHFAIWLMFPVGMFSWIMLMAATVFFDPSWPRVVLAKLMPHRDWNRQDALPQPATVSRSGLFAIGLWLSLQCLVPLRFVLYPGHVNWTEQGFRFAWRVMLVEKTGHVEYRVSTAQRPHPFRVYPRQKLEPFQYRMLCTQPDMIHEYALHIAETYQRQGHSDVKVFADAFIAWNGRPARRAIDPHVDLASRPRTLGTASWILPHRDGSKR